VKCLETLDDLNDNLPDVLLLHELLGLLAFADSLEAVSVVGKFHNDAKLGQ